MMNQNELIDKFTDYFNLLYPQTTHKIEKKNNILVISQCCLTKVLNSRDIIAHEMYKGLGHTTIKKYILEINVDWAILSGGYGVINARESKLSYYNDVMHDLSQKSLKKIKNTIKYNDDLIEIIKHDYDEVIFCISDHMLSLLDLDLLRSHAGKNCKFRIFILNKKLNSDFKIPPDAEIIILDYSILTKKLSAPCIALKEKITGMFLQSSYKNINDLLNDLNKEKTNILL